MINDNDRRNLQIKGLHSYSLLAACAGEQYSAARKHQNQILIYEHSLLSCMYNRPFV